MAQWTMLACGTAILAASAGLVERLLPLSSNVVFKLFNIKHLIHLKWSGKFGQRAKMYPTRTNGYENDKATELFRPI